MSFNSSHANGGVIIFNGEVILLYCDGVEISFSGDDVRNYQGTKKGKIFLTTHRMIFVNGSRTDLLQSFATPFMSITAIELEQPVFGANYIKGKVKGQQGGSWSGTAGFKLKFMKGGAIEFGQAMLQAAKMASRYMPPQPPPYYPMPNDFFPAQPPVYMPPPQGYTGFVIPNQQFPNSPPPNSVYTYGVPPPYPGIASPPGYPGNPGQPTHGQYQAPPGYTQHGAENGQANTNVGFTNAGNDAKSLEAAQSAYYNPYNPNNAYVPVPPPPAYAPNAPNAPPMEQPPSYTEYGRQN